MDNAFSIFKGSNYHIIPSVSQHICIDFKLTGGDTTHRHKLPTNRFVCKVKGEGIRHIGGVVSVKLKEISNLIQDKVILIFCLYFRIRYVLIAVTQHLFCLCGECLHCFLCPSNIIGFRLCIRFKIVRKFLRSYINEFRICLAVKILIKFADRVTVFFGFHYQFIGDMQDNKLSSGIGVGVIIDCFKFSHTRTVEKVVIITYGCSVRIVNNFFFGR